MKAFCSFFLIAVGSACAFSGADDPVVIDPAIPANPPAVRIPVETVNVTLQNLAETLDLTGTVQPWDEFTISAEVSGKVASVRVDEGDWVSKGQLLLELDRTRRELELRSRKAQLSRVEVELEYARKRLARARVLLEKGAISQSEVDTLEEGVRLSENNIEVSRLAIETIEEELEDTNVYAPADGQIVTRSVSLGSTLIPATPLFTLAQLDPVKVMTEITEPYLRVIRTGDVVKMQIDAFDGRTFAGKVHRIHSVSNADSGAFPLEIRLNNTPRELLPGMVARITLHGKSYRDAYVVPLEAIVNAEGEDFVFRVDNGVAHRTTVVIRERLMGYALLDSELTAGQKVVVRGNRNLIDGTPVEEVN